MSTNMRFSTQCDTFTQKPMWDSTFSVGIFIQHVSYEFIGVGTVIGLTLKGLCKDHMF